MPNKIKLFFIFLGAMAVVSVLSFFDVLSGVRSALLHDAINPPVVDVSGDTDNDGLSDSDESYWNTDFQIPDTDGDGFLDGEEVASRRDPTLPGPDDDLLDLNITQKITNLAAGGLMEGSLKLDNPNFDKSVDDLSLAVVDEGLKTLLIDPNISNLRTIDSSSENEKNYIKNIEPLWEEFFKTLGNSIKNMEKSIELTNHGGMSNSQYINYFLGERDKFNLISDKWLAVGVPASWRTEHIEFLRLIQDISRVNEALARGKDDPIRATMAFNLYFGLMDRMPEVIKLYSDKAKAENVSSELFN